MFGTFSDIGKIFCHNSFNIFTAFGLQYNLKCNIQCSCCYDLNADTNNYLNEKDCERWIKECGERKIGVFMATGEPFLYWDWIKNFFLPLCKKHNVIYLISTNGYWGKDNKIIQEILDYEIEELTISVDWWHQQFVPLETIYNILKVFEKTKKPKIYISQVFDKDHSKYEVYLPPFEEKLTYIDFIKVKDRWDNDKNIFTHDWDGNIYFHKKKVGKSIYDVDFNFDKDHASFGGGPQQYFFNYYKQSTTRKKELLFKQNECFVNKEIIKKCIALVK